MARQGTTPIVSLEVEHSFDGCDAFVTIDQDGIQVTKSSMTSEDIEITEHYDEEGVFDYSIVAMYLTQAETLGFEVGNARVQIRWVDAAGNADATEIGTFRIEESLLQEVIEYGN